MYADIYRNKGYNRTTNKQIYQHTNIKTTQICQRIDIFNKFIVSLHL